MKNSFLLLFGINMRTEYIVLFFNTLKKKIDDALATERQNSTIDIVSKPILG